MRGRPRQASRSDTTHCAVVGCVMRTAVLAYAPNRSEVRSVGLCVVHQGWAASRPELFGFAKGPVRIVS